MTMLVGAVFLASLLGSLHCVGMCGAFLATIAADGPRYRTQFGYHGGRLLTYVGLGILAGFLGRGLDLAGATAGLRPIATTLSAAAIILMGTVTWMRLKGIQFPQPHGSATIRNFASRGYRFAMNQPPVRRALIVGLLTTLLPCGWLWTFLVTAAGTANPATAAGTMFVFWLGTLPAMAVFGAGFRALLGSAQRRVPTITCAAMIAIGLFAVAGRMGLHPATWASMHASTHGTQEPPCCETDHANAR